MSSTTIVTPVAAPPPPPPAAGPKVWYQDLAGFLTLENYYQVLPTPQMTLEEKLNTTVRFFLYLGVLLALLRSNASYLLFGVVAAVLSILVYGLEQANRKKAEKFLEAKNLDIVDNAVCTRSTVENPFMNPTMYDLTYNPDRPQACPAADNKEVQEKVEKNFHARLWRDVGDLWGKFASERQFYTVPATTIPNDAIGFAKWAYGTPMTCKEGNGAECYHYAAPGEPWPLH